MLIRCPEQAESPGPLEHRPFRKHRLGSLNCAQEDVVSARFSEHRPLLSKSPLPPSLRPPRSLTLVCLRTPILALCPAQGPGQPGSAPWDARADAPAAAQTLATSLCPARGRRSLEAFRDSARVHPPSGSPVLGLQLGRTTHCPHRPTGTPPSQSGQTRSRSVTALVFISAEQALWVRTPMA